MVAPAAKQKAGSNPAQAHEMIERRAYSWSAPAGRCRSPQAVARPGGRAAVLRLSAPARSPALRGFDHEPQEDPAALPRKRPVGALPTRAKHDRDARADPDGDHTKSVLVVELRTRPVLQQPVAAHSNVIDDVTKGMPRRCRRHLNLR